MVEPFHAVPPAVRDRYFASLVLAPFTVDLIQRLPPPTDGPLLEVMADTGLLTQALLDATTQPIVATEPDPGRLDLAASRCGTGRVIFRPVRPDALPFQDGSFGAVTCHFGIADLPDPMAAYREIRRVMVPSARFVFTLPAALSDNPVAECIDSSMITLFPKDPPPYLSRALYGSADEQRLRSSLVEAGFRGITVDPVERPYIAATAREAATGYCLGTALRPEIAVRTRPNFDLIVESVTNRLKQRFGKGRIESVMRSFVVSAAA